MASPLVLLPAVPRSSLHGAAQPNGIGTLVLRDAPDPHLRSMAAVMGYHIHTTDGAIGHIENLLVDDADWSIRYLIIDTRNWWPGRHVLMSPYAVQEINWSERLVRLDVTRQ